MRRLFVWLLLLGLMAHCGRKGPPLPPLREVPETTTDLAVFQEENSVVLRWSYPSMTRSGRPLGDLASVEVWKAPLPPGQEKAVTGPQGGELKRQLLMGRGKLLARLAGKDLEAATKGSFLEFRESVDPKPGQTGAWSLYAVRSRKAKGGVSDFSNVVAWQPTVPPPPPEPLEVTPTAQGIELRWPEASGAKFRVERLNPDGGWTVLGEVSEPRFLDHTAAQGNKYAFRVRLIRENVVGFPSALASVNFLDIYPPPMPANLLCLPEERRVTLRWGPATEPGVKYKIFRRLGEGPWEHLEDGFTSTLFVDHKPPVGELTYAVRAVDKGGNESEPATCKARGER